MNDERMSCLGNTALRPIWSIWLVAMLAVSAATFADEEDDEPVFRPGLVGAYSSGERYRAVRVDRAIGFDWGRQAPDRRLPAGDFSARWSGLLQTEGEGAYQLYAHAAGKITILLDGKVALEGQTAKPDWVVSKPLELPYGYYPLEVRYQPSGGAAKLALYWTGPGFQLEPLGEKQLVHRREDAPEDRFERGGDLVHALRCAACHEIAGEPAPPPAPDLTRLAGNVSREWLIDWLADHKTKGEASRRMPKFALAREEAAALAAWLMSGRPEPLAEAKPGDQQTGETLFLTTGCLACHKVGELGESGLYGGGDLTHVGDKRPAAFFAPWLANPAALNRRHRMPVFDLSAKEQADLAAYLASLRSPERKSKAAPLADEQALAERGQDLFAKFGCAACHPAEEQTAKKPPRSRLASDSRWRDSCLGEPAPGSKPGYALAAADQAAMEAFISGVSAVAAPAASLESGRFILRERGCTACHSRQEGLGLAAKLPAVAEARPDLAPLIPAMTPPSLISVGDKLHDSVLLESISRKSPVLRPWLKVRMPRFNLSSAEQDAVVKHLIAADRIPERMPTPHTLPSEAALHAAGARLVTSDGFGCTSCHQVGKVLPQKAPLAALGPDLSLTGRRVREPWFERWVRNPARIVPRMEMPSVQIPVRGVLGERLDDQLSAVWHVLNEPGFEPPLPNAVRILRREGREKAREPAVFVTDVVRDGGQTWIKPLLVGLPNRHNGLFDLETNRLAAWWLGDAARQRTEGKSWHWEPGSKDLLQSGLAGSEVRLLHGGKPLEPLLVGQFPTELDSWEQTEDGLTFRRRLRFDAGGKEPIVVAVTERWAPFWFLEELASSGWHRDLEFEGVPAGSTIEFRLVSKDRIAADTRDEGGWLLELKGPGENRIEIDMDHEGQPDRTGAVLLTAEDEESPLDLRLDYIAKVLSDPFLAVGPEAAPPPAARLHVVPGFEAVRLPLPEEIMPTALAWRADGALLLSSLKGQVYLAQDKDRDGLADSLVTLADGLAAPYGLVAGEKYVDVITKFALLRLHDENGDNRAERLETLASGWGHTADYHDWAVGLETDPAGNRYIALPCQQDKRSPAASHLRGRVLRLVPREPTAADPRRYRLEELSAGHRFPMGLARTREGELFVTDNQGNYNPFNELNHVIPGARYGFINESEKGLKFPDPPLPAAIEIPHPWTRSVNGICILQSSDRKFGPFEGHLIGCEYDTRRLVRFSLERVGDVYQGACYPFTLDAPREGEPLLGPLACAVSPAGDLYVGCIRDSGWGGANNIGAVTRLKPLPAGLPAGVAEVRAAPLGFVLEFTAPVDAGLAASAENYSVASYRRISTPAYGGPDVDRRVEKITRIEVDAEAKRAVLHLSELRPGFVYEIRLKNLAGLGREFHPAEAYYTLRKAPR